MIRVVAGTTAGLTDVESFLRLIDQAVAGQLPEAAGLFTADREIVVTRAPGRLDVMGGIADYSGAPVLQWPIAESTRVALQLRTDRQARVVSLGGPGRQSLSFALDLGRLEGDGRPIEYERARAVFRRRSADHWAAYVVGAFLVLARERGVRFTHGAGMLIASDVPEGKGVSSSAALEVAAMQAVAAAWNLHIEPRDMALLCQKVENLVVGAPCGVMDQMTSVCGQPGRLLALLCQPAELLPSIEIPPDLEFWGLDSGVRHAVSGGDYGSVRTGAFMGYRIIAGRAGLKVHPDPSDPGHVRVEDPLWHGYLANISPSLFEQDYAAFLPTQISGRKFLEQYGGTTDPVTEVSPRRRYPVRQPTAHPIHESFRVRTFAELLSFAGSRQRLELLGELMYQSHASYSACGLGSPGTDLLVALVRRLGPARGLYGAKITGGGSGGTVAVLARRGSGPAIAEIAQEYARQTGHTPLLFSGSSPGAAAFGHLRLQAVP